MRITVSDSGGSVARRFEQLLGAVVAGHGERGLPLARLAWPEPATRAERRGHEGRQRRREHAGEAHG